MRPSTGTCIIAVLECSTPPSHLVHTPPSFSDTSRFFISTGLLFTNLFEMPA
jgi:hypothetical protein